MATLKDDAERRDHQRFAVAKKFQALAIARFDMVRCQILDVSTDGLSFSYEGSNGHPVDIFGISILLQADFWGLSNLPVKTMWVREYHEGEKTIRISGVRFEELSHKKKAQLEHFINHHTRHSQ